ncbi:hybrid sensor histidine kinase/response regulator [Chitinimonas sp.]|uniref:hybrid sensor histidine kinase/response regulator n=1 Tax=Chitinimonas sp. TaxID=1934313 RepID=UPI002F95C4A3
MADNEESLFKRLLVTFKAEAEERLRVMQSLLQALQAPDSVDRHPALIEALFREAHSLKGAARAVHQTNLEAKCGVLESMLARLNYSSVNVSGASLNKLFQSINALEYALSGKPSPRPGDSPDAKDKAGTRQAATSPERSTKDRDRPTASLTELVTNETVRISTTQLTHLLNQTEELSSLRFKASHLTEQLAALGTGLSNWRNDWGKISVEARLIRRRQQNQPSNKGQGEGEQRFIELLEAVERDVMQLKALDDKLLKIMQIVEQDQRHTASVVDNLLDNIKQALILPLTSWLELFPKLVRDQAKDLGKDVAFQITGTTGIEIDRRILEQLKDPLIHLVRNCLDHGIETSAERTRWQKPPQAQLTMTVQPRDGNMIELVVADDGRGIDLDEVRSKAVRLGLLQEESAPSEAELLTLLFESGFSTSPLVTDISGRGLGLAIVRQKVEALGGRIEIQSEKYVGTAFHVVLPTSFATFRGLLITVGEQQFVLPSSNVARVARIARDTIRAVEHRETIVLEGQVIAVAWLADVLELPRSAKDDSDYLEVVLLGMGAKSTAFVVDHVDAEYEVLVKPLGPPIQRLRNIAAVTILGTGRIVPILSVTDLLKSAAKAARAVAVPNPPAVEAGAKSIMIVEDSITSRSLLRNIFEMAGYVVSTAFDGIDALTSLRARHFDLVISDVEMPRLDGFGLTRKIRQEPKLKNMPVVLVTTLDSSEDRARGIDVGADAYIVKSGFDQSHLLDVVQRLL